MSTSNYHNAFKKSEARRKDHADKLPEGIRVRRSAKSSLDTPVQRFFKMFFGVLIGIGAFAAVALFIYSFQGDSSPAPANPPAQENAFQSVEVNIGFKPAQK